MTVHHKLVRDRIPQIIEASGRRPVVRVLEGADYRQALLDKVGEELAELAGATGGEVLGELADLLEVLRALTVEAGFDWDEVTDAADAKAAERGGFQGRVMLVEVLPE